MGVGKVDGWHIRKTLLSKAATHLYIEISIAWHLLVILNLNIIQNSEPLSDHGRTAKWCC